MKRPASQPGVKYFPAGRSPLKGEYLPGDFILTHGTAFYSGLIRLGQRIRYGSDSPFAYYNHAAMIVDEWGTLVEALGDGVSATHIDKYAPAEYHLFSIRSVVDDRRDRERIMAFAKSCIGQRYDWMDIASISISLLTGSKLSIQTEGHMICSGLVSRALERSAAIFPRPTNDMMPADLAAYFLK